MLAHSPRLQFVTGLPDSPKTKTKGVVLVKGSWYEKPGSRGLPFDLNQSFSFPSVFHLGRACTPLSHLCFDMPFFFSEHFVDKHKRGRLVSLVEKASLDRIKRLLEIIEGDRNHELLLYVKSLQELGSSPFPYIVPVIPCLLPGELIKGEHFVLVDLLKSMPSSSSQAGSAQDP